METDHPDHPLPLHRAILNKDVVSVGRLLRRRVNVNDIDHLKQSPILLAIKTRQTTMALVLFDHGGLNICQEDAMGKTALHYAMENNDCVSMTQLLARHADLNTSCNFGRTPLIVASTFGYHNLVKRLVRDPRLRVDQADNLGSTALWHAANHGHPAIVRLLMENNANTNAMDSLKKTPLIASTEKGHVMCVQALLSCDLIRVDHRDKWGFNSLYYAFQKNLTDVALELVRKGGACLRYKTPLEHKTLLMTACQHGNITLAELCLTHDTGLPAVNAMDSSHRTALYYACKFPHIVSLLLQHFATPGYMDICGKTPVMRAAEVGSVEVIDMLIEWKVDLDLIDFEGMTALAYACMFGKLEAAKVLVRAGASPLISDMDDKTPLHLATIHGHAEIVAFLVDQKNDVGTDYRDFMGLTALHHASVQCDATLVAALLQKGASTIPDISGVTPLMRTCHEKNVVCTRLLLPHSEIDARDEDGRTALMYACCRPNNLEIVQLLLSVRADVGVRSEDGCTALMEACQDGGRPLLVEVLLDTMTLQQINSENRYLDTALSIACAEADLKTVCLLLNKGADPFKVCANQVVPVMLAASRGESEMVEELAKRTGRYHLDSVDDEGLTALYHASLRGHESVVKTLVAYGADATIACSRGTSPLLVASEQGLWAIVVTLVASVLSLPSRLRYMDKANNALVTPLYQAVCFGFTDTVDFLLQHGATQYTADGHGDTPLMGACISKRLDMVERLLESATLAEVNHVNHLGRSALFYAISFRNITMMKMLEKAGASAKPLFDTGAIWNCGYPDRLGAEMLCVLTDTFRIDVNARNRFGRTALYVLSATNIRTEARVAHFLMRGADPWLTPEDGVLAIDRAPHDSVRFLLKNAMLEPQRFHILDKTRTLFHMLAQMERASCVAKTREGKRLKSMTVAPVVLKERLLLGTKVPMYNIKTVSTSPLVSAVLGEVVRGFNDDVFRELFEMMRVPWDVDEM